MTRLITLSAGLSLLAALAVGCSDKAKTEQTTTVKTPGGTTEETVTHEVTKSGDNPPAAPSEQGKP